MTTQRRLYNNMMMSLKYNARRDTTNIKYYVTKMENGYNKTHNIIIWYTNKKKLNILVYYTVFG